MDFRDFYAYVLNFFGENHQHLWAMAHIADSYFKWFQNYHEAFFFLKGISIILF